MYHSRRMRTHQSTLAKLDNIFKPIESMFEDDKSAPFSSSSGRYSQKRNEEKLLRPFPFISRYIESTCLGSPRTGGEFKALVHAKPLAVRFLDQLKPKSKFFSAALKEEDLPLATLPEIAVVGRSNSGKSTLINAIVGTRCCQVEDKPGSTKELLFYRIGDPPLLSFVDVPGFGFAYGSSKTVRTQLAEFALWYLRARRNLRCVILVTDARHGLADADLELITFFKKNKIEYRIVMNKCDLVDRSILAKRLTLLSRDLEIPESQFLDRIVPVSALRRVGIERIRSICEQFKLKRDIVIAGQHMKVMDLLEERRLRKQQKRAENMERKENAPLSRPSPSSSTCFDAEPRAYTPDSTSILKRVVNRNEGDVNILEFENFVSEDEIRNLGTRRGNHLPSPDPESENTNYETKMKLNHALDWKMQLELDLPSSQRETFTPEQFQTEEARSNTDISALGFISTDNAVANIPKGIKKWKVIGMKPVTKTSRKKPKPSTAEIVNR